MSPSLSHVTSPTAQLYHQHQTGCDYLLNSSASCPGPWDNTSSTQQQQQQQLAAAAAGLFRKSPSGFSSAPPHPQQQALSFSPSLSHLQTMEAAAIQQQQQQHLNRSGPHQIPHPSHPKLQQLQTSQHRHSLPNLNMQPSHGEALNVPLLSPNSSVTAHPSEAAGQGLSRQAMLNHGQQAAHYAGGRPVAHARPVPRVAKLGTVQTYNAVTGIRTVGSGTPGPGGSNPRTLGGSVGSNGLYLRQGPAAAGMAAGLHPTAAAPLVQADQLSSLQALIQQQQEQLGAYKMLSAFQGAASGAGSQAMSPDQQSALMQSLLFPQHSAPMNSGNFNPGNGAHQQMQHMAGGQLPAPDPGARGMPGPAPFGFNGAMATSDGRNPARSSATAIPDARGGGDGGAAGETEEEDLDALLHCIGTELARHNISVASATEAGWLGSVSPAAHAALHRAHAAEAAKMRRSCSNLSVLGSNWRSVPSSICLSSSAPNSASLSSTVEDINGCLASMEDFDPLHQGGLGSLNHGPPAGIAAVEEPLHQQITQLLAGAGDWGLDPTNFLASVGFGGQQQAMMGAAGGSASCLREMADGLGLYQQGLERTRSGPPLSAAQFANLSLGIGFN